jgi:16S rRNA (guanine966-N2)-methyltransferase
MRITGGLYRGRILEAPKNNDVRPTSDKVRLAVFNMLNGRGLVDEAVVLDAFCGTGALGIEAMSWGASQAIFIDKARTSLDLAKRNCAMLGIEAAHFILKDSSKLAPKPEEVPAADLIFLDPPYRLGLVAQSLESLHQNGWLSQTGHSILCEAERQLDQDVLVQAGYDIVVTKDYGDTRVLLAQK